MCTKSTWLITHVFSRCMANYMKILKPLKSMNVHSSENVSFKSSSNITVNCVLTYEFFPDEFDAEEPGKSKSLKAANNLKFVCGKEQLNTTDKDIMVQKYTLKIITLI